ncbi:MAG: flagellar hook-basal body complex protein FliE [Candidatus Krumholzibacteriia bacterium]
MAIGGIRSLGSIDPRAAYGVERTAAEPKPSFADQLAKAVDQVQDLSTRSRDLVDGMVAGRTTEVHDVMIAAKESQLAFELLVEVRNKLLEAYQELMRMQV